MNEPTGLRAAVQTAPPDGAGDTGTVLSPDEAAALHTLSAYFGSDSERRAVRVVVGGEDLGYLERGQALALLDVQSRGGYGNSSGWGLPGVSDYEEFELRCPVDRCSANPILAGTFDERYPPRCPQHPGQALSLARA